MKRIRIVARGAVQGVGFRPFAHALARSLALTGATWNDARGAVVEVQGEAAAVDAFAARLVAELPPPGLVTSAEREDRPVIQGEASFVIAPSDATTATRLALAPDAATCPDCLRELFDPRDRRFRHPFLSCARCGPRATITRALPYDRPATTMAAFPMCEACAREYHDVTDRRHHAQPISCPRCGPRAWLVRRGGDASPPPRREGEDPAAAIDEARARLAEGAIVAIKGIGGFHLAVDARSETAVARLRAAKRRPRKALAVMARGLEVARALVDLDEASTKALASPAAPIVLAPARDAALLASLAPGLADLGVMLPYSPLHHLLLDGPIDALVMTSGNAPSEPITTDDADALAHLPADAFLLHDRAIHAAHDDSILRSRPRGPGMVRRARGFVPRPLDASALPRRRVLALGAELKVAIALLAEGDLVVGRHLGDLGDPAAERAFRAEITRLLEFARVAPEAVACDLHPDLASTLEAERAFADLPIVRVQHHHAHLAAVLIEHGVAPGEDVAAIVLDGYGHGEGGGAWGGEVLVGGYARARRVGHLREIALPGGDRAAREPGRMATSLLVEAGLERAGHPAFDARIASICGLAGVSPRTSSAGRLFDGIAALLGVAPAEQESEGEAAARLEAIADAGDHGAYPLPIDVTPGGLRVLDTRALVGALVADRAPVPVRAARFHDGLADGLAAAAIANGLARAVLGGGSMVNRRLAARLRARLEAAGIEVLEPRALPAGDGGLAAGQAAVAACILGAAEGPCA